MSIILDVEFALAKGVPKLDGAITGARHDLPVVSGETDGEDIGGVTDETTGSLAGVKVPETESVVPGRGERELAVGGDDDVRYEVVVALQLSLRVAVRVLAAGEGPDDDSLVSRRGEDNVRVLRRRRDCGDPALVSGERTNVTELVGHIFVSARRRVSR